MHEEETRMMCVRRKRRSMGSGEEKVKLKLKEIHEKEGEGMEEKDEENHDEEEKETAMYREEKKDKNNRHEAVEKSEICMRRRGNSRGCLRWRKRDAGGAGIETHQETHMSHCYYSVSYNYNHSFHK